MNILVHVYHKSKSSDNLQNKTHTTPFKILMISCLFCSYKSNEIHNFNWQNILSWIMPCLIFFFTARKLMALMLLMYSNNQIYLNAYKNWFSEVTVYWENANCDKSKAFWLGYYFLEGKHWFNIFTQKHNTWTCILR